MFNFYIKKTKNFKCPVSIALLKNYIYVGFAFNLLSHLYLFFILIIFCKVKRAGISLIILWIKKTSFREAVMIKIIQTTAHLKLKFNLPNNLPSSCLQPSKREK